jgi:hypothetical protein
MRKWNIIKKIFFTIVALITVWMIIEYIVNSGQIAHFQAKMLWLTFSLALADIQSGFGCAC